MMGHKREKREKQDIGETYATYWIRKHQAEMCRYQPIVRENSMVTLRTNRIPEKAFVREGSLMNMKSSPRKNNELNFARDLTLSGEPAFYRDHNSLRETAFFHDHSSYCDQYASCHNSDLMMDGNSGMGDSVGKQSLNYAGSAFLPEKSRKLFERWDSNQENFAIPQRKYTILPQIGNPRFISVQDTRHQFANQLDYSRDNFERDADFFADYNKSLCHEEIRTAKGVPLPPLNSVPPRLKFNFVQKTQDDISEETSRCFTNSMTLSDNLATSTLDEFSDDDSMITSANAENMKSVQAENTLSNKPNNLCDGEVKDGNLTDDFEDESVSEKGKEDMKTGHINKTGMEKQSISKQLEKPDETACKNKEKKPGTSCSDKTANIQKPTNSTFHKTVRKFMR